MRDLLRGSAMMHLCRSLQNHAMKQTPTTGNVNHHSSATWCHWVEGNPSDLYFFLSGNGGVDPVEKVAQSPNFGRGRCVQREIPSICVQNMVYSQCIHICVRCDGQGLGPAFSAIR